jgi:hypothetical protein
MLRSSRSGRWPTLRRALRRHFLCVGKSSVPLRHPSMGCEAAQNADCAIGDEAKDEETSQSDHHAENDRRAVCVRRLEHEGGPHSPDRDQSNADREQGRSHQDSQTMKSLASLQGIAKHRGGQGRVCFFNTSAKAVRTSSYQSDVRNLLSPPTSRHRIALGFRA